MTVSFSFKEPLGNDVLKVPYVSRLPRPPVLLDMDTMLKQWK